MPKTGQELEVGTLALRLAVKVQVETAGRRGHVGAAAVLALEDTSVRDRCLTVAVGEEVRSGLRVAGAVLYKQDTSDVADLMAGAAAAKVDLGI